MKKILFLVAMMATMVLGINAQVPDKAPAKVPAYHGMIERVQPNGELLRTFLRGDERKHWMMTEDGWLIREDNYGWLKYVKQNRKGELVTSRRKAHNEEDRGKCEKRWLEKHGIKKSER